MNPIVNRTAVLLWFLMWDAGSLGAQPDAYAQALADRADGRLDEALATLSSLTKTESPINEPYKPLIWEELASIHRARLRYSLSLEAVNEGLSVAGREPAVRARLMLSKGELLLLQGKAEAAMIALRDAEQVALRESKVHLRTAVPNAIALAYSYGGDDAMVKQILGKSQSTTEDIALLRLSGLAELAASHARLGEHRESREALETAETIYARLQERDSTQAGAVSASLAFACLQAGMWGAAERYLRAATAVATRLREPALVESVGILKAVIDPGAGVPTGLFKVGDPPQARSGQMRFIARVLRTIGSHALEIGRVTDGIRALRLAGVVSEVGGDEHSVAVARSELGAAYLRLGRADEAAGLLDGACIALERNADMQATCLWRLAFTGRGDGALAGMRGTGYAVAAAAAKEAATAVRQDYKTAQPKVTRAQALARAAGPVADARLLNNLGHAYLQVGDPTAAERAFRDSLVKLRAARQSRLEVAPLWGLAASLERKGNAEEAIASYVRGISLLEERGGPPIDSGFDVPEGSMHQTLVRLLVMAGRGRDAFAIAERSRALASRRFRKSYDPDSADLLDSLVLERTAAESRLADGPNTEWEARHDAATRDFAAAWKRTNGTRPRANFEVETVQASLPEDLSLLAYFDTGHKMVGFALRRNHFVAFEASKGTTELASLIQQSQSGALLQSQRALRQLYTALIAPVQNVLSTPSVAFVPSGILCSLPFAALMNGEQYLIDTAAVFLLPAAATLMDWNHSRSGANVLWIAGKGADAAPPTIAGRPVTVISERRDVFSRISQSIVAHFAGRAVVDPRAPWSSRILIGGDEDRDNAIDAVDLRDLSLKGVSLVLLTRSERMPSSVPSGEESLILTREFLTSGAETVVTNAWPVSTVAANALLQSVFEHLSAGRSKGEALRNAQLELRRKFPYPGIWSAFTLVGYPGRLELPQPASSAGSGMRIMGTLAQVEWPVLEVVTKDDSKIRVSIGEASRVHRAGRDVAPHSLAVGTAVVIRATVNADSTFSADDVEVTGAESGQFRAVLASEDPVLTAAAETAQEATAKLLKLNCHQLTRRSVSLDGRLTWSGLDEIRAQVVYVTGHEQPNTGEVHTHIEQNRRPRPGGIMDLDGYTTSGELGTVLRNIFRPSIGARFTFRAQEMLNGHQTLVYDLRVDETKSDWHLTAEASFTRPAYGGSVWIDKDTRTVWKISHVVTQELPKTFAWRSVQMDVVYDIVQIPGAGEFLLPSTSTHVMCRRDSAKCYRNEITFAKYERFTAESNVLYADIAKSKANSGALSWSGKLEPLSVLTLRATGASTGSAKGDYLPGVPVSVHIDPPLVVVIPPNAANGWREIALQNKGSRPIKEIRIEWVAQP